MFFILLHSKMGSDFSVFIDSFVSVCVCVLYFHIFCCFPPLQRTTHPVAYLVWWLIRLNAGKFSNTYLIVCCAAVCYTCLYTCWTCYLIIILCYCMFHYPIYRFIYHFICIGFLLYISSHLSRALSLPLSLSLSFLFYVSISLFVLLLWDCVIFPCLLIVCTMKTKFSIIYRQICFVLLLVDAFIRFSWGLWFLLYYLILFCFASALCCHNIW